MAGTDAVDRLMAAMTLEEKIGQLNLLAAGEGLATGAGTATRLSDRLDAGQAGAIFGTKSLASARAMQDRALKGSRLGIPLFFAEDVIHGHRTVFPLPVALACSWDMGLIEETAAFAAAEAASEGLHQVYAPMIDISRDPRWGRVAESPGEDPFLGSAVAVAMTRGLQGRGIGTQGCVAACLKHFVAYGATESGRDYDNVSLAWEDLLEVYLPPFAAGVEAGAASVMAAFNAVNKLPMHAHDGLIDGWLRRTAGFDGLVVSDYTGVKELQAHGLGGPATVVARALLAGIDMDMVGEDYLHHLPRLAAEGLTDPDAALTVGAARIREAIDTSCRRVLAFKAALGLLDDPYRGMTGEPPAPSRARGREIARRAAAASAVLLKNDGVLPLAEGTRVALVGPFADDRINMLGTWAVSANDKDVVTLREAVAGLTGSAPGCCRGADVVAEPWLAERLNVFGTTVTADPRGPDALIAEAVAAAEAADVVIAAVGEAKEFAGESSSRLIPDLPAPQFRLVAALKATGKPLVVVVFAGRPLSIGPEANAADALLYAWHGGVAGPEGVADVLFGRAEPSGRLSVTLPVQPGEAPVSYAAETTGRPFTGRFEKFRTGWLDLDDAAPRFPFGFGLGWGRVRYGAPALDRTAPSVSVEVTNEGLRATRETVQMYLSDPVARRTRPGRRLVGYVQVDLAPGETRTVTLPLNNDMARYPMAPSLAEEKWVLDPGIVNLHVGPNSRDTRSVEATWPL